MPFVTTISYVARRFVYSFFAGYFFLPFYLIIISLIKVYYDKSKSFQADIAEFPRKAVREILKETVFFGLVSGFTGSIGIVYAGVVLDSEIIIYILMIMIALSIVNIRFLCTSYAAGILILARYIFSIPDAGSTSLLFIVAVIHLAESVLIFFNGAQDNIPVYIQHKDSITGAFLMQKFWPMPIIFLSFVPGAVESGLERFGIHSWWPAFKPDILGEGVLALTMDSIIAVAGYTVIAITKQPEQRARETAYQTFAYSLVMFFLGILSAHIHAFKVIGAIFAIAAHEAIVLYNYYTEKHGEPLFTPVKRGIRVFDILPGSHAEKMGIKRGDIILRVNGKDVQTEDGIIHALREFPAFIWIDAQGADGSMKAYEYKCYPFGTNDLGILIVPREREVTYKLERFGNFAIIKNLVARFRNG